MVTCEYPIGIDDEHPSVFWPMVYYFRLNLICSLQFNQHDHRRHDNRTYYKISGHTHGFRYWRSNNKTALISVITSGYLTIKAPSQSVRGRNLFKLVFI